MSSGFSGPSLVCRVCGDSYPANSPTCPRCGYTPQASTPRVTGMPRPRIPEAARRRFSVIGAVVVLIGLLLPLAAGVVLFRSVSDDVTGEVADGVDRRRVPVSECRSIMTRYVEQVFASLDDADEVARVFIDASNEFGAGSRRWRAFVDIAGDPALVTLVARGKPAKALRTARPAIAEACRR
jgi:hypothetical protein